MCRFVEGFLAILCEPHKSERGNFPSTANFRATRNRARLQMKGVTIISSDSHTRKSVTLGGKTHNELDQNDRTRCNARHEAGGESLGTFKDDKGPAKCKFYDVASGTTLKRILAVSQGPGRLRGRGNGHARSLVQRLISRAIAAHASRQLSCTVSSGQAARVTRPSSSTPMRLSPLRPSAVPSVVPRAESRATPPTSATPEARP